MGYPDFHILQFLMVSSFPVIPNCDLYDCDISFSACMFAIFLKDAKTISFPSDRMRNGFAITKYWFNNHFHSLLLAKGYSASEFSSHSLHTDASSTAAQSSIPPNIIKTLGKWSLSAYKSYVVHTAGCGIVAH